MAIKRRKPPNKKRKTLRRGELTKDEKDLVRLMVAERAEYCCELKLLPECIRGRLPFSGVTPWDHGHLVHLRSIGAGGEWSMSNCRWGCHVCHLVGLHNPKSVPPKIGIFDSDHPDMQDEVRNVEDSFEE